MTLRHVIHHIASHYPGGAVQLAKDVFKPGKVFEQKLGLHDMAHLPNVEDLELIADVAVDGNYMVADYFANKTNSVVVRLPNVPDLGDMGLLDSFMQIMRELGELSSEFQTSYADGVITNVEYDNIAIEVNKVQSKLLQFQSLIKCVTR